MLRATHRLRRDEEGFGLIEAVVALLIAGVVFGALATSLMAAVQASLYSRQNQQAADFMTRELEAARALDFGALAHPAAITDGRLVSCPAGSCLPVSGTNEPVLVRSGGAVQHTRTLAGTETNNTQYTVRTIVTQAHGQPVENVRRVSVQITWMNRGVERTRSTSTLIAYTQRGLPLPVFRLDLAESRIVANPGATFAFEITLSNLGAPDTFSLSHNGGADWRFVQDDGDSEYDPSADTTVITSTGRVDPAAIARFYLVRDTSSTTPTGTQVVTVTARSVGQPTASGSTRTVQATAVLQSGAVVPPPPPSSGTYVPEPACAATAPSMPAGSNGYSVLRYTLQSNGIGATPLQPQMYMANAAGDEPVLAPYSTDLSSTAKGRILRPVPAGTTTDAQILALTDVTRYADWAVQYPKRSSVDGQPVLRVWVHRHSGTGPVTLRAVLYGATTSGSTLARTPWTTVSAELGTITCAVSAAPGWQEVYLTFPDVGTQTINRNAWMGVRVVTTHATADEIRLAYDVPEQFRSSLTARVK
jgi:Tfp pilus assembly protein PilV